MDNHINIKSTEILSDKFFPLKWVEFEFEKMDGAIDSVKREVYQAGNGVTALLYNRSSGNIILIRQFRLAAYLNHDPTGMLIETCAGLLEENEDPADAMIREIEEETGYRVDRVEQLFELYSTAGSVTEKLYYFIAEYSPEKRVGQGGGLKAESEDIEVLELPFEDAYLKIQNGEIRDAKTVILLQYARFNLFQEEKVFDIL